MKLTDSIKSVSDTIERSSSDLNTSLNAITAQVSKIVEQTAPKAGFLQEYQLLIQIGTIVVTATVGFLFARYLEKKKFEREMLVGYAKAWHKYLFSLNEILTCVHNIRKIGAILLEERIAVFLFDDGNDFKSISEKITNLQKYLSENITAKDSQPIKKRLLSSIEPMFNTVLDYNLIINLAKKLNEDGGNYVFLIDKELKKKYDSTMEELFAATSRNFDNYNLTIHKAWVVEYIKEINSYIEKSARVFPFRKRKIA